MKKLALLLLFSVFILASIYAQECVFYYPKTKGALLEYKNFDKKEKLTGKSTYKVKEITETGVIIQATIEYQSFDSKGKDLGKNEYSVKCENGVYSMDMRSFLDAQTMEAYKDMQVDITSTSLEMPSGMKVGDQLPDGKLIVSISNQGVAMMTMTTTITDRKVEATEQVTTEAGTFDCLKITYTITTKMMIGMRFEVAQWFAEGVGSIKTENYSKGNKMSSSILTGIQNVN
ncbi:MAG: hypothetical protein A2W99_17130 [Bacteroidetes bacterium GWF2_33_16]|nr:MAG: hypothetical protein A2X00_13665 [Bacteroidetes bacterium GWE2_32_14]OFY03471.1 MAG: hypothetical protein A2W99_17130 [Bacteroidetes bacterium GWF2_33_16]